MITFANKHDIEDMANEIEKRNEAFLIYQDENGIARVNVRFEGEDVWLNVEQMMEFIDASQQDISYHLTSAMRHPVFWWDNRVGQDTSF